MDILGSTFFSLLAMLVTLGILVTIHEYGHFIIARLCGVRVERFSIGFGKPLLRWRGKSAGTEGLPGQEGRKESTEYVISALPLGGYVKMLGEQDDDIDPALRRQAFGYKPLHQRAAIVAAGPIANFLLAILLYCGLFMNGVSGLAPVIGDLEQGGVAQQSALRHGDEITAVDGQPTETWQDVRIALLGRLGETGSIELQVSNPDSSAQRSVLLPIENWHSDTDQPDLLGSLGIVPFHLFIEPRLEEVLPDGRAQEAGLQGGDLILSSDGETVQDWNSFQRLIQSHPEQPMQLEFERDGLILQTTLTPAPRLAEDGSVQLAADGSRQGYIGARVVVPELPAWMSRTTDYSLPAALSQAFGETVDNSLFVLDSIRKMIVGDISVKNLSGPITIAQVAGETASSGIDYYVSFLALLSISLGVLNLLPIPVLDGGHLFYYAIEAVIRRPVPRRMQELGMQIGMMLVGCIMVLALFNDVNRLF